MLPHRIRDPRVWNARFPRGFNKSPVVMAQAFARGAVKTEQSQRSAVSEVIGIDVGRGVLA
jgi:hypothetical protein